MRVNPFVRVPALDINELINEEQVNHNISILSIDVEGIDFDILQSLNFEKFSFDLIVVEHSDSLIPNNSNLISSFLKGHNYFLIHQGVINLIFVRKNNE